LIDDIIQLKTFVIKAEGVTSIRIVEIHNNTTDKLVAKSETNWCFINSQTKRPTKIIKEIRDAFNLINR
jgi:acyl-CoA thioester hydrolase